jgi:glycosyltransferase involved in cell wall biosynthesis
MSTNFKYPMVSIIMPAYNCEKYIHNAIRSVINQSFTDWELIVVDDGSTDNTPRVVQEFVDSRILFFRHEKNRGAGAARNTAIAKAHGEWGALLDADDMWDIQRLSKLVEVAKNYPHSLVADDIWNCLSGKNGDILPWKTCFSNKGFSKLLKNVSVSGVEPQVFIKYELGLIKPIFPLKIIKQLKISYSNLVNSHDMEFYMQCFKYGLRLYVLNEPLYYYRMVQREFKITSYLGFLKVYEYLLNDDGYNELIREALEIKYNEFKHYRYFVGYLKSFQIIKALSILLISPNTFIIFIRKLPHIISLRFFALKMNVKY